MMLKNDILSGVRNSAPRLSEKSSLNSGALLRQPLLAFFT